MTAGVGRSVLGSCSAAPLCQIRLLRSSERFPASLRATPTPTRATSAAFSLSPAVAVCRARPFSALPRRLAAAPDLLRVAVPEGALPIIAAGNPCYMTVPLPEDEDGRLHADAELELIEAINQSTAVAVGPGLGRGKGVSVVVQAILEKTTAPLVLDADGLNALPPVLELLKRRQGPSILTPHPGEFARLLGCDVPNVQSHREELTIRFAADHNVVLVLKGRHTLVSDGRRLYVNDTGNPGMATGGTGDVLTGLTVALMGQGLEAFAAGQLAVYLHGSAGDLARDALGETALIAADLLESLPYAFMAHATDPAPSAIDMKLSARDGYALTVSRSCRMIAYEPVVSELPETTHRAGTIRRPADALPALLRHIHCAGAANVGRAAADRDAATARAVAAVERGDHPARRASRHLWVQGSRRAARFSSGGARRRSGL